MGQKNVVRILCHGDSLTAGYTRHGAVYHPYAGALHERLVPAFPHTHFEIADDGVPGELACSEDFIGRLREQCADHTWDWTIVLGGTNDLGWGRQPEDIFPCLRATWEVALRGGRVLALTVPECDANGEGIRAKRDRLNGMILGHKAEGFHAFDLKTAIPYHSLTAQERDLYWDDGLHLTAAGYDWMGGHIADALIEIMKRI